MRYSTIIDFESTNILIFLDVLGGDELPTDVEEIEKSRDCFEK